VVFWECLTGVAELALDLFRGIARVPRVHRGKRLGKRHVAREQESRIDANAASSLGARAVEDLVRSHQLRQLLEVGDAERRIRLVA
jgi:hypothetical protein